MPPPSFSGKAVLIVKPTHTVEESTTLRLLMFLPGFYVWDPVKLDHDVFRFYTPLHLGFFSLLTCKNDVLLVWKWRSIVSIVIYWHQILLPYGSLWNNPASFHCPRWICGHSTNFKFAERFEYVKIVQQHFSTFPFHPSFIHKRLSWILKSKWCET